MHSPWVLKSVLIKCKVKIGRVKFEEKKDIVTKHESDTGAVDPAAILAMPKCTVYMIFKNKDSIKAADVAKGVTTLTSRRLKSMEKMKKLIIV